MPSRYCVELPVLTVIDEASTELTAAVTEPSGNYSVEIAPIAVCLFSKYAKPLEANYRNISLLQDRHSLAELIGDATCDEISVLIWPQDGNSPLAPMADLLRQMLHQHVLGRIPDTYFMRNWLKAARGLLADYNDIAELLAFEEPTPTATQDMDH